MAMPTTSASLFSTDHSSLILFPFRSQPHFDLPPRFLQPPSLSIRRRRSYIHLSTFPPHPSPPVPLCPPSPLPFFQHSYHFHDGSLLIRPLLSTDSSLLDSAVLILAESFSASLYSSAAAGTYTQILTFLIKQYLIDRLRAAPHVVVLVGVFRKISSEAETEIEDLAVCTAEVSLDEFGAIMVPPTPPPPKDCPYICNMAVAKPFRRKGIGKQLLAACEKLIVQMKAKGVVYLHCRVIDKIPLHMYKKAGYKVVDTDSFLVWLSFQRRKILMCKQLLQIPHEDEAQLLQISHENEDQGAEKETKGGADCCVVLLATAM